MVNKVRWGLLSTAKINHRLIGAIRQTKRGTVAGVASRSLENAETYAAKWEIPKAFGGYEALLTDDGIDAVYISLPNHLHARWAVAALQVGKHVLCEKPIALTVEEMDQMIAAANQSGCILAEAFMYLHHPQSRRIKEVLREGTLGKITLVRATLNFTVPNRDNIRLNPTYGGGALWDVGSYGVSFAQFIFGLNPTHVQGAQLLENSGVDENFSGQLQFPGGGIAQFSASLQTPYHQSAEITGTNGRLTITRPFTPDAPDAAVTLIPRDGEPETISIPEEDAYLGQVRDMHAAILDGTQPYLDLKSTRDRISTILDLYRSARSQ